MENDFENPITLYRKEKEVEVSAEELNNVLRSHYE